MANSKIHHFGRKLGLVALILLTVASIGTSMGLYRYTLVDLWIPVTIGVLLAAGCALFTKAIACRWLNIRSQAAGYLISGVVFANLFVGAFFAINLVGADYSTTHTERASIERLYSETRHRTRRVGRGRYVANGEAYQVYYAVIRLADGRSREISLTLQRYNSLRRADSLEVEVCDGALGAPVFKF